MTDKSKENSKTDTPMKGDRIAKVIARAGLCSRRDAERWIADGRVAVNGDILSSPACTVTDADQVVVDGRPLQAAEQTRLFLYHKKPGLITSSKDERGRATVFDDLPDGLPRTLSIGRLDINTEGLLLLTNDGELARYMELPSTGIKREYRVRVLGNITDDKLEKLKNGMTVDGVRYGSIKARIEKGGSAGDTKGSANTWLVVNLKEGKNREIRRVMEALDLKVNRLIRTSYGTFHLGTLPKGGVLEIPHGKIKEHLPGFFNPTKQGGQEKTTKKSGKQKQARGKPDGQQADKKNSGQKHADKKHAGKKQTDKKQAGKYHTGGNRPSSKHNAQKQKPYKQKSHKQKKK